MSAKKYVFGQRFQLPALSCRMPLLAVGGALCGFAWGHMGLSWLVCLAGAMPLLWSLAEWERESLWLLAVFRNCRGLQI